jgi:hypothetical protein
MKRLALTGIAILGVAQAVLGQGSINLDNSGGAFNFGVAINTPGNYYGGTYGLEVWELSGASSVPAGINLPPAPSSGLEAYNTMVKDGFDLQTTFVDKIMPANSGALILGQVNMPDVTPAGSTVVLALAAWNNSARSWTEMLNGAYVNPCAGVVAFLNPTTDYFFNPPRIPASITGWNSVGDLVMTSLVPEPGTFALSGLGVTLLLIFRKPRRAKAWFPEARA